MFLQGSEISQNELGILLAALAKLYMLCLLWYYMRGPFMHASSVRLTHECGL